MKVKSAKILNLHIRDMAMQRFVVFVWVKGVWSLVNLAPVDYSAKYMYLTISLNEILHEENTS